MVATAIMGNLGTEMHYAGRQNGSGPDLINDPPLTCSIIIPVCQGGPRFRSCLEAAIATIDLTDEIIVVADGQGDGSWQLATELGLRVINLAGPYGPSRARNRGANVARGDILFFLDADVVIPHDAVARVRRFFASEKDVAAIIGSYDEEPAELNFHSQYKNLFHHFVHQHGCLEACTFWGACGAIRRQAFVESGGYDETYERPCIEDIELGYRLTAASQRIRLLPELQVKHLKRWTALSLIESDMLDRAAPWTELIWDQILRKKKRVTGDLNLAFRYRLSLITSFVLIASCCCVAITQWALAAALFCSGLFLFLQIPFVRFFTEKRGIPFALQALVWRFGYDIYSGLGFCYGSVRFAHESARRVLSHAYAKLDSIALGAGVGSVFASGMGAITVVALIRGSGAIDSDVSSPTRYFPGYSATWMGCAIGLACGFAAGFIVGYSFAFARNMAMRLHLASRKVQQFLARTRQP
jgi:GT2 family glycosyltransferase